MKCLLCRSSKLNELLLGTPHFSQGHVVHQNCLYLSSNLVQRGDEVNDICCFTLKDIKDESRRTQNLTCCYCHKGGANIGCCNMSCRRTFHTYCGIQNGAQNQYTGTYKSFCNLHIKSYSERPKAQVKCAICMDPLIGERESFSCTKYIQGKCCNNGWYHKDCLQRYADSAGYFFKCPLCNNSKQFRLVALWGITVPDRDASWEQTDAFADQLEVPLNCTAIKCRNKAGRKSSKELLNYCTLCGGNPMHPECTTSKADDYCCNDCVTVAKMSVSYMQEEEPLDPLEIYIANQQAIRKQASSARNLSSPVLLSDSEDDFEIIVATIERKRMEAGRNNRESRRGNTTPLSTAAPLRMHNYQASPPVDNVDSRPSSHSNVTLRRRTRSISRLTTLAARLNAMEEDEHKENHEKEQLPPFGTAVNRRTRSSSRLTPVAARLEEKQGDSYKEKHEDHKFSPPAAVQSRRTRSSSRLTPVAARLEEKQGDSYKVKHEEHQFSPPTAVQSRRTRSSSRLTPLAARLDEKQEDRDMENHVTHQSSPPAAVLSRRTRSSSRLTPVAARLEEKQGDSYKEKHEEHQLPLPGTAANRRTHSSSRLNIVPARLEEKQLNNDKANHGKELWTLTTTTLSRQTRSSSGCRQAAFAAKQDEKQANSDDDKKERHQLPPHRSGIPVSRRARSSFRRTNVAAKLAEMQGDSDKENNEEQQTLQPAVASVQQGSRLCFRRNTITARLEEMQVDNNNDDHKPRPAAIVRRRQTCVSPSMLQKDTSPLISRGRQRKRTIVPQTFDISCIAKRTRARSRK
ncbi:uncharacterized protein LOC117793602 [Drosophila innubila]|uniref:uncharacterized protein LOC117793602 n=1 Tax=Drosophila innubila TaxID=198719 RepID=UPI00148C2FDC|nr:uncharacterized protein LOC117793602 [Drosophila innubila]